MIKRLEQMAKRFAEVNEQIQDPELVKDPKKYKDIMREHSHLSSVMEAYEEYKSVLQGIEDAKVLITEEEDHDMKEMAREELKGLEEKKQQIEEKIKFL
ncbi:MAG: PCRF domain-containing protein, partial [Treponema sp.]|nr:PCRF domain-containing protein [Treponema sp.]